MFVLQYVQPGLAGKLGPQCHGYLGPASILGMKFSHASDKPRKR
jgi:hypothetical protein